MYNAQQAHHAEKQFNGPLLACSLNQAGECSQLLRVEIRHQIEGHTCARRANGVKALRGGGPPDLVATICHRPHESIDDVLASLIDEGSYRAPREVVEAPPEEWIAFS